MLEKLIKFVETAYTPTNEANHNLMYDKRILDLVDRHGCTIEPFNLTTYIVSAKNIRSKIMGLCKVLRRLGIFCELVSDKSALISHDKDYLKAQATLLRKSTHYLSTIDMSSTSIPIESLKEFVEMANVKLKSTTFAEQVKELESMGYIVNNAQNTHGQIQLKVKAAYLTVGEIVSARAKMESYAEQIWLGNTFTHFVVKYGVKSPVFSIGVSLVDSNDAVKLARANY